MDKTEKGRGNLEQTVKAEDLPKVENEATNTKMVKSEKLRADNADSIYE